MGERAAAEPAAKSSQRPISIEVSSRRERRGIGGARRTAARGNRIETLSDPRLDQCSVRFASALLRLFPGKLDIDAAARLFGSTAGLARLKAGDDPAVIAASWGAAEGRWRLLRAKYLLY